MEKKEIFIKINKSYNSHENNFKFFNLKNK